MMDPYNRSNNPDHNDLYPVGVPMGLPYNDPQSSFAANQHKDLECGAPLLECHSVDSIDDFKKMPSHSVLKLCPFCQH